MTPEGRNGSVDSPSGALVELVRAHRGRMSSLQRVEGARSVVDALESMGAGWQRGRLGARALSGLALGMAIVAAVIFLVVQRRAAAPLSYTIDGGRVERDGSIAYEPATAPMLRFSDGSELRLSSESKASLAAVDGRGARVALTAGRAHVDIVHAARSRWLFDAGPFLISVTGTAFTFGWKPADEQLDVQMDRGSVEVRGPLSDGPLVLRSGQHLTVRVRERETLIRDRDAADATDTAVGNVDLDPARRALAATSANPTAKDPPAPAAPSRASLPEARVGSRASLRRTRAHDPPEDWAAELAAGDFEAIVQQAESAGVDACLADAPSADLAALADAARYGRHDQIARRALLAQRRRFPLSAQARDASFLLGRLEEAEQAFPRAITWYDRYLEESPGGTYASEALGRKMNLTQVLSGAESARAAAAEYLDRFPQGTYATRARALAKTP
jgi:FecR protein